METYHGYRQMIPGIDGQPVSCRCVVQVVSAAGLPHEGWALTEEQVSDAVAEAAEEVRRERSN